MAAGWEVRLARESHRVRSAAIDHAADTAQRLCAVDTGALISTIEGAAEVDSMASRLSAGDAVTDYAAVVELGGRPHEIRSHGAYPLRDGDGNTYGRVVQHPGTPAQPYLRPGVMSIAAFSG